MEIEDNSSYDTKAECVVPKIIYTSLMEGIGNSWGVGGSQMPPNLSKCMKLDWNFQRGGGGAKKT